jgi:hypothetical protein
MLVKIDCRQSRPFYLKAVYKLGCQVLGVCSTAAITEKKKSMLGKEGPAEQPDHLPNSFFRHVTEILFCLDAFLKHPLCSKQKFFLFNQFHTFSPRMPILIKCDGKCHEKLPARPPSQILMISILCLSAWKNGEMPGNACRKPQHRKRVFPGAVESN